MKKSWTNGRTKRIHVPSPYKPRAYKLCGCLGGGILVENSSPDCCPLSCLVDVALDEFLDIHLTVLVLGILFALLACLLACPIIHGHIYYDECVIHTVWAGCFGTLAMNIYTKIWFNEVSFSREVPSSGVESCCWLFQAWLSCHVLILTFTLASSMNAIAD